MKVKKVIFNAKTGKIKEVEEEMEFSPQSEEEEVSVDLKDLKKLVEYAKSQGWI